MNNEPGIVTAKKGSRNIHHVMSGEKGGTKTVVTCRNAGGNILPSYCIFKGKRTKPGIEDSMPLGSHVEMNETCAYINSNVFMKFQKDHFIPRKEPGEVFLILDSHASHC
ncbi:HTH CENPB-type domain-containing protein [Trichonephila clavata]|uniref:HTH CENPB-type domain-containing protein n=1 Tax=Trichonephila clavata TaxID=2740835 RepID=A0A8X6LA47_TRICU|nr:HTH CENPB-type domain-containing protein [Trichonephila clavata]